MPFGWALEGYLEVEETEEIGACRHRVEGIWGNFWKTCSVAWWDESAEMGDDSGAVASKLLMPHVVRSMLGPRGISSYHADGVSN